MMFGLSILAAAALAAAPQLPPDLVTPDDYPAEALRKDGEGAVVIRTFVDPRGRAMRCEVESIAGHDFSQLVCGRIMRARIRPAMASDGTPAYGFVRTIINFWLPGSGEKSVYPLSLKPDLAFSVKPVPGLLTAIIKVEIAATIDGQGQVADCAGTDEAAAPKLVAAACAQARAEWSDGMLEDPQGTPRNYVRKLTVSFEPETAAP
jgi:hypothetical protein